MPDTTNGSVRLHWDEKGTGTPILLVMGATYSSAMWYPVVDALAEHHQLIWFDNRGFGGSSKSRSGSIEDMATDATAVLDAAGIDSAHIYGVSLGGVVTLQLALQSPQRVQSLVLGCTGILSNDKPRAPRSANLVGRLPAGLRRRLLTSVAGRGGYGSAAPEEAIARDLDVLRADRTSATGLVQQQNALRAYSVTRERVAEISAPSLVLHGTEDGTVPYAYGQELAQTLPDARLVTLEGAGHNYLVSYPERANAAVLEFLAAVDSAGAAVVDRLFVPEVGVTDSPV